MWCNDTGRGKIILLFLISTFLGLPGLRPGRPLTTHSSPLGIGLGWCSFSSSCCVRALCCTSLVIACFPFQCVLIFFFSYPPNSRRTFPFRWPGGSVSPAYLEVLFSTPLLPVSSSPLIPSIFCLCFAVKGPFHCLTLPRLESFGRLEVLWLCSPSLTGCLGPYTSPLN